jgi:hypothetical protein
MPSNDTRDFLVTLMNDSGREQRLRPITLIMPGEKGTLPVCFLTVQITMSSSRSSVCPDGVITKSEQTGIDDPEPVATPA